MAIAFRGQFYFAAEGQSNFIRVVLRHHRPLSHLPIFNIGQQPVWSVPRMGRGGSGAKIIVSSLFFGLPDRILFIDASFVE